MIWKITNALGQEVIWYNEDEINKILYKNCPCRYQYNVFGVPDKYCCYKYHKYCDDVKDCKIKEGLNYD